ncbi:ubiquitin carboxyl-terminal hydrolase 50-like isoform X2 [Halichoeres trimaculatus]
MNQDLVKIFRKKLRSLNISDYHGLKSPGLTCYLNCILQVLFMTDDFREAVKRCSCQDSTTFDSHLADLFAALEKEMAKTHAIIRKLGITNVYEQRDAAEYFEKILCRTSQEASKMFKGELNHRIKCLKCKKTKDSRSFFWILPLVVEDSRHQTFSVKEGLEAFFKWEKVCGENKIFCSHCKKKQDEEFECEITQSPEVLTLLLKRFSYDYVFRCYIKLHCKVEIPKTLHVANCTYDLYAVVDHFGELTGGHYTAQIKSFETQCWYSFNDESVRVERTESKAECLRSHTAYLLMYRKVSKHLDGNVDAFRSNFDVEAKVKLDGAQREEVSAPHYGLKDKHIPKENFKHMNGEITTEREIHGDVLKKQANFSESLGNPFEEVIQRNGAKHPTLCFKNFLLENKHETKKKGLLGKNTNFETLKSTATKTKKRETDVGLTGNRVQPAVNKVMRNKTEDDIRHKMSTTGTVTRSERRLGNTAKSRVKGEPWR